MSDLYEWWVPSKSILKYSIVQEGCRTIYIYICIAVKLHSEWVSYEWNGKKIYKFLTRDGGIHPPETPRTVIILGLRLCMTRLYRSWVFTRHMRNTSESDHIKKKSLYMINMSIRKIHVSLRINSGKFRNLNPMRSVRSRQESYF